MNATWQLQEAKNKLSEVVEAAQTDGPQIITRRGAETAIVLSYADYRKLLLTQKNCQISLENRRSLVSR